MSMLHVLRLRQLPETMPLNYRNTRIPPEVAKNLKSIRTWVDKQRVSSGEAARNKAISDVGGVPQESITTVPCKP